MTAHLDGDSARHAAASGGAFAQPRVLPQNIALMAMLNFSAAA